MECPFLCRFQHTGYLFILTSRYITSHSRPTFPGNGLDVFDNSTKGVIWIIRLTQHICWMTEHSPAIGLCSGSGFGGAVTYVDDEKLICLAPMTVKELLWSTGSFKLHQNVLMPLSLSTTTTTATNLFNYFLLFCYIALIFARMLNTDNNIFVIIYFFKMCSAIPSITGFNPLYQYINITT